jgi:hypothetical protein
MSSPHWSARKQRARNRKVINCSYRGLSLQRAGMRKMTRPNRRTSRAKGQVAGINLTIRRASRSSSIWVASIRGKPPSVKTQQLNLVSQLVEKDPGRNAPTCVAIALFTSSNSQTIQGSSSGRKAREAVIRCQLSLSPYRARPLGLVTQVGVDSFNKFRV